MHSPTVRVVTPPEGVQRSDAARMLCCAEARRRTDRIRLVRIHGSDMVAVVSPAVEELGTPDFVGE